MARTTQDSMSDSGSIEISGLLKSYSGRKVVNGVSFEVKKGQIVGLLGPNGAGKTTTFYMVVGLVRPEAGTIRLNGNDITRLPMYKRARLGMGYLPQESSIFKKLTVEENILMLWDIMNNVPKKERESRLLEILKEFGLSALRYSRGVSLSGGERRRVEIARTLAMDPNFILLDEPFAGIDPITVSEIKDIIRSLKDRGIGIIITDHNVKETLSITEKTHIIHQGQLLFSGTAEEIANNKDAKKFYLGDDFRL